MSDMRFIHICYSTKPNCYNAQASAYGNCYGCGCCSRNKKERYANRLKYFQEELDELEHFKYWAADPVLRAVQEENIKADIKVFKRRIQYYEKRLRDVTGDAN